MSFHEVRFPTTISRGAQGGPERRTDVVVLGSGFEERNSRWAASRRRYNAGYGVTNLDALHTVIAFFEERRGRLYGFRWKDHVDFKSCAPSATPTSTDQQIGMGDGTTNTFQLSKTYGGTLAPWQRDIKKPVAGTVQIAVNGQHAAEGSAFSVDATTGSITFQAGYTPVANEAITAGFEFDVPVRFDADTLEVNLTGFSAGAIPNIPLVEVRI